MDLGNEKYQQKPREEGSTFPDYVGKFFDDEEAEGCNSGDDYSDNNYNSDSDVRTDAESD